MLKVERSRVSQRAILVWMGDWFVVVWVWQKKYWLSKSQSRSLTLQSLQPNLASRHRDIALCRARERRSLWFACSDVPVIKSLLLKWSIANLAEVCSLNGGLAFSQLRWWWWRRLSLEKLLCQKMFFVFWHLNSTQLTSPLHSFKWKKSLWFDSPSRRGQCWQ